MSDEPGDVAYQSLYRRYRPQRFAEVRGQEHVTTALRNAVRQDRVAHAYLFSGPRGTGKTSTARILAMALDCAHPADGEPDGTCPSCVGIRRGSSMDVQELDAASNRKLDEMRDLLSRVSLGTGGRWKVYIIDEVHQLTPDAASALLKTLEEPPAHVVFVLATTDPQKVLPTIRSRTQHYEFRLLSADTLGDLLAEVNQAAGLGVAAEAIDLVVRRGHGSARDALSVLDQVAAAGTAEDESAATTDVVEALADQDVSRVLVAVAEGVAAGREPRRLATDLLEHLRNGFLTLTARGLVQLPDDAAGVVEGQARRMGLAGTVRALEVIGEAAADMRDSVDPRVTLEVALVRLAAPAVDTDVAALAARLERLEARVGAARPGVAPPALPLTEAHVDGPQLVPSAPVPATPGAPGGPATPGQGPPDPTGGARAHAQDTSPLPTPSTPTPPTAPPAVEAPSDRDVDRPRPSGRPLRPDRPPRREQARAALGAPPPMPRPASTGPGSAEGEPPAPLAPASLPRPTIGAHRPPGPAPGRTEPTGVAAAPPGRSSPAAGQSDAALIGTPPTDTATPPTAPAPTDPAPTDRAPIEAAPSDPAPTDPAPTDLAPVDPAPTGATPVDPAPTGATPVDPAPTGATPVDRRPSPPNEAEDPARATTALPSRDELTKAWGDAVLPGLPARVKAYLAPGRFLAVEESAAVFALPDQGLLSRAAGVRPDAEAALSAHFRRAIALRLVLDAEESRDRPGGRSAGRDDPVLDDPSDYDVDDMEDAGPGLTSPEQRLLEAFPGAEEVAQ